MMFISYNQNVPGLHNLESNHPNIERTCHMDIAYPKFKSTAPSLFCFGSPGAQKSHMINEIFGLEFEEIQVGSAGLFHDSVDAIFTSNDVKLGFNIFDFQGSMANRDYTMIESLLKNVPQTYILLQINDLSYLTNVLQKIDEDTRKKLAKRTILVCKECFQQSVPAMIKRLLPGFDDTSQLFKLEQQSGPKYDATCQKILELLQQLILTQKSDNEKQILDLMKKLKKSQHTEHEYKQIYGFYWLLSDSLNAIRNGKKFQVKTKDSEFRKAHMSVKNFLFSRQDNAELSRKKIFPIYTRELRKKELNQKLDRGKHLDDTQVKRLKDEKARIKAMKAEHGMLFKTYLQALKSERQDMVSQLLELVEAQYAPRVADDKMAIKRHKEDLQRNEAEIIKLKGADGRLKEDATPEEEGQYQRLVIQQSTIKAMIERIMIDVEDKVLDSELFLREAKQYFLLQENKDTSSRQIFTQVISQNFEDGQAMEVIDGDIDQIERTSFASVLKWVHEKTTNNLKLLVVTILGPQSSGKSTLLNYLFGAKFHVSAGRCTKGLNAMLLRTDFEETKEILILDSEGIFSIERSDPTYDRRLAIFCLSVSNILLINIKGELSIEIQKVLEVAIYALNKLAAVQANARKARIQFILRDQIASGAVQMEAAFETLKGKLREAAAAAQANLEELIVIPNEASEIITMFPSALDLVNVRGDETLQHTRSSNIFRKKCSMLRLQILNVAKSLSVESRHVNVQQWGNEANTVLAAVMDNDDLVAMVDLSHINNQRRVVVAIEQFRIIMSQLPPILQDDETYQYMSNPLLEGNVPDELKQEQLIREDQTIFALFSETIATALWQQEAKQQLNPKKVEMDAFMEQKKAQFLSQKSDFQDKYADQAVFFTQSFNEDLQRQAVQSVKQIINSIYSKAMEKWQEKQAASTIDSLLQQMKQRLQKMLFDQKKSRQPLSKEQFKQEIAQISQVTKKNIKQKFFKQLDEMHKEATEQFGEIVDRFNKADDNFAAKEEKKGDDQAKRTFNILKKNPPCFQKRDVELTDIEKDEQHTRFDCWAHPNLVKLDACIQHWIKTHDLNFATFNEELIEEEKQLKIQIQNLGFRKKGKKKEELLQQWQNIETMRQEKMIEIATEMNEEQNLMIQEVIKMHIRNFAYDINRIKKEIRNLNLEVLKVQNIPNSIINKLHEVFQTELKRQNEEMNNKITVQNQEEMMKMIEYETKFIENECNQILFNILFSQIKRNVKVQMTEIKKHLKQAEESALQLYDQLNSEVGSDLDAANRFVKVVYEQLLAAITKDQIELFDRSIITLDAKASKEKNLQDTNEVFQEAEDTETIIQHMCEPVDLERRVFKKEFKKLQVKYSKVAMSNLGFDAVQCKQKCQNFIERVKSAIDTKGEQMKGVTNKQKQDVLMYMLGCLIKDITTPEIAKKFIDKKGVAESHQIFQQQFYLPRLTKKVIEMKVAQPYKERYFKDYNKQQMVMLSENIKDLSAFIKLIQFSSDSNDQTDQLFAVEKAKLTEELYYKRKRMDNYNLAEDITLGCLAKCFFCGARCMAVNDCKLNNRTHSTHFHRPMAFKGSFTMAFNKSYNNMEGKKYLMQDFCTSEKNFKSRWPKQDKERTSGFSLLRSIGEEGLGCNTIGMNVVLLWDSGSDLDIQVKCACGIWHGYGTEGGSGGSCRCEECEMERDHDIMTGEDGRDNAIEHVIFKNPKKLIGKEIGMAVHNFSQSSKMERNDFRIGFFNEYGHLLYPIGSDDLIQEKWMFCENVSKSNSEQKFYTLKKTDIKKGSLSNTRVFKDHSDFVQNIEKDAEWDFSLAEARYVRQNNDWIQYNESWNAKWQIVKDIMCGKDYHNSELLDNVLDIAGENEEEKEDEEEKKQE